MLGRKPRAPEKLNSPLTTQPHTLSLEKNAIVPFGVWVLLGRGLEDLSLAQSPRAGLKLEGDPLASASIMSYHDRLKGVREQGPVTRPISES